MILENSYLSAIKELKKGETVFIHKSERAYLMASRLVSAGLATWDTIEGLSFGNIHLLRPIRPQSPETTPTPVIKQAQAQVDDSTKKVPAIGDTAVLSSARGIASNPHKIIDFNNGYAVLQHPVLSGNLYRKVVWNETVQGWVA